MIIGQTVHHYDMGVGVIIEYNMSTDDSKDTVGVCWDSGTISTVFVSSVKKVSREERT